MDYEECRTCGAAVESMARHRRWHKDIDKRLDDLEGQLDDVQSTADHTANILFQRGID